MKEKEIKEIAKILCEIEHTGCYQMLHTTFRKAKEEGACIESYRKMAKALGGVRKYGLDTLIGLNKILEVCGLDDALWSLRIITEQADKEIRLFACDCAERVLPIFEKEYPDDKRPRTAIEVLRKYAVGEATQGELAAAWDAARDARDAAWAAARAAGDAGDAEREWQKERFIDMLEGKYEVG